MESTTRVLPTNAAGDSVHHQWKSAPPGPQSRRSHCEILVMTWPSSCDLVVATQRELPADLGLEGDVALLVVDAPSRAARSRVRGGSRDG